MGNSKFTPKDLSLLGVAIVVIGMSTFYVAYNNYVLNRDPSLVLSRPIGCLCQKTTFADVPHDSDCPGCVFRFNLQGECNLRSVAEYDAYSVSLESSTIELSVNGILKRDVIGLVANNGLDWDCDFDMGSTSVIEYDPTNGSQSNGDIICLYYE